jgi:transposase-like protein
MALHFGTFVLFCNKPMSGRPSQAVQDALREYRRNGGRVYRIAAKHRISASSLYRAIKDPKRRNHGT